MVELGKFRSIAQEDLTEFAYGSDKGRMRPDVENLIRQGLVQMKSIPHEERGSRQFPMSTRARSPSGVSYSMRAERFLFLTRTCRELQPESGILAEKVLVGFSIYAHASDVSNLRRVPDQRELTAEILSL
jgi:hypothetical protein